MTKTIRAGVLETLKKNLENAVMGNMLSEYDSFKDYVENEYEGYSKNFKDDEAYYAVVEYCHSLDRSTQRYTDDLDLIEEDGTVVSYRTWSKDIRGLWVKQDEQMSSGDF
jgi:hypothetical protein